MSHQHTTVPEPLTLGDLRRRLAQIDLPPTTPIVLAKDAEGNGYSPLFDIFPGLYHQPQQYQPGDLYLSDHERAQLPDGEHLPRAPQRRYEPWCCARCIDRTCWPWAGPGPGPGEESALLRGHRP